MQAFVTGASGFIGTHLVRRLAAGGWKIRALVHANPVSPGSGLETVYGDIRDPGPWKEALSGTDVLFHLAAALGSSRLAGDEFLEVNALGTEALLGAAREAGIAKVVHVSSAGVIGAVKPGAIADEATPPNPRNAYDRSKLEAERIALVFAGRGMDLVVVRPGWVYGPGDRRTFKVIKAVNDRRFALVAPDRGRQTPVFIDDLVAGLLLAAGVGKSGEIYHLTGDEVLTVRGMAAILAEACGVPVPKLRIPVLPAKFAAWALEKAYAPFRREAPLNRSRLAFFIHPKALSNEKARRELGFRPEVDFRTGAARAVAWYREQGWL
ncbi:MAG TPA: NAD-dependent epimerase/dehydratase family protein [Acidobacteriota bacterium]|nr:NAD-dependent epimerase/dehydratase family protein [Acidobacteriota bacterium]